MNFDPAFLYATLIGQFVGVALRAFPSFRNALVPKAVFLANFVANLVILVGKFNTAAGVPVPGGADSTIALAGIFSFLLPVGKIMASAGLAYGQLALQRVLHEYAVKPVLYPNSEPKL